MLILSRHKDESIVIGENIKVMVVQIRNNKVRLGITAPPEIGIWRSELRPNVTDKIPAVHRNSNEPLEY